jgi:hypothetical protein
MARRRTFPKWFFQILPGLPKMVTNATRLLKKEKEVGEEGLQLLPGKSSTILSTYVHRKQGTEERGQVEEMNAVY